MDCSWFKSLRVFLFHLYLGFVFCSLYWSDFTATITIIWHVTSLSLSMLRRANDNDRFLVVIHCHRSRHRAWNNYQWHFLLHMIQVLCGGIHTKLVGISIEACHFPKIPYPCITPSLDKPTYSRRSRLFAGFLQSAKQLAALQSSLALIMMRASHLDMM